MPFNHEETVTGLCIGFDNFLNNKGKYTVLANTLDVNNECSMLMLVSPFHPYCILSEGTLLFQNTMLF